MILALALALFAQALPAPAQTEAKSSFDLAVEAHLAVVRAERELDFLARYGRADAAGRARAADVLERLRSPGSPGGAPSAAFAVAKAARALDAPPPAPGDAKARDLERLQELVDALDMQATPGIFAAGAPAEGQLVRVVVYPLYAPPEPVQVTLSLSWQSPQGSAQLVHRGLAKPDVFGPAGFSLEIAAPGSEAGEWSLGIEIERDGIVARGPSLRIESVPRLAERAALQFDPLREREDPRQSLARAVSLASQRGMRSLVGLDCDAQLARLEGQPRAGSAYPWGHAFTDQDGDPHWIWRLDPPGPVRASVVLLAPVTEPPEAALARPDWIECARSHGWRLLSTHLPRGSAAELFARMAPACEGAPSICIARGDAVGRLAMGFHGSPTRPYAAEILLFGQAPKDPALLAGPLPRLVLAPGGRASLAEAKLDARTWWLDAHAVPLIAEHDLPLRLLGLPSALFEELLGGAGARK